MIGVSRNYIHLDWDKMKVVHPEAEIRCMQHKWDLFREDWSQGWDSDCFAHCSNFENCKEAFDDPTLELENHFKEVVLPVERRPFVEENDTYELTKR